MNEVEDEVQESDTAVLISEEDGMTKEHAQNRDHVEDGLTELFQDGTVKRWKFWKKQRSRRYIVHSDQSQSVCREVKLCGRKFKLCGINSWRAIFLVLLFVFFVAIAVSVIVSKLAAEPPAMSTDQPPTTNKSPTTDQPQQGKMNISSFRPLLHIGKVLSLGGKEGGGVFTLKRSTVPTSTHCFS